MPSASVAYFIPFSKINPIGSITIPVPTNMMMLAILEHNFASKNKVVTAKRQIKVNRFKKGIFKEFIADQTAAPAKI